MRNLEMESRYHFADPIEDNSLPLQSHDFPLINQSSIKQRFQFAHADSAHAQIRTIADLISMPLI